MMSFMESTGSLMKRSGLSESFSTYDINTIEHTVSGKAVSRELRGHFFSCISSSNTPLFSNSNLKTDSYNNEFDQSDTEFDSCNDCENEFENDEDIESIGKEYIEVKSIENDFCFDTLSLKDLAYLVKLGEIYLTTQKTQKNLLKSLK